MGKFQELTKIHIMIRKAKLEELDVDLKRIFEGVSIDQILDIDLDVVLRLQEIRLYKQMARRR